MNTFYRENGYYIAKNIIPEGTLEAICSEIRFLFKTKTDQDIFNIYKSNFELFKSTANISQYLISLTKLSVSESLIDIIKTQLGLQLPVINTRPLLSFSSSRLASNDLYWKVPAHQDWPSMYGSIDGVTAWLPLVEMNMDMGYLEVIPKSHLAGALEQQDDTFLAKSSFNEEDFVSLEMQRNDILFFSTFLVHRSGVNKSDKIRLSAHFRYDNASEESFIKRQFPHHRIDQRKSGNPATQLDTQSLVKQIFTK